MITSQQHAMAAIDKAWPTICEECLAVLGSELHYQAMIYHALRMAGDVPVGQLGMNVKQWIPNVRSALFKSLDAAKHEHFQGGFEPIPDVVIFSPAVANDWRRRRREHTVTCMLAVVEVKASERAGKRLSLGEVTNDVQKLSAHREEVQSMGHDFHPVMLVVDSAHDISERMRLADLTKIRALSSELGVEWRYVSPTERQADRPVATGI